MSGGKEKTIKILNPPQNLKEKKSRHLWVHASAFPLAAWNLSFQNCSSPFLAWANGWVSVKRGLGSRQSYSALLKRFFRLCKALPGFFFCILSSLTCCMKEHVSLASGGLLRWKVPARLYWDLLTRGRYQPPSHYF
jgi:hypothetical protein